MMKKFFSILPTVLLSIFLIACSDEEKATKEQTNMDSEMVVDASDFYHSGYVNKLNQLITWTDAGVMISGTWLKELPTDTTDLDMVLEKNQLNLIKGSKRYMKMLK